MHPNAFLQPHWRAELRPEVFVAMSFDPKFDQRFENIITPSVERLVVDGLKWRAIRVDITVDADRKLTSFEG